MDHFDFWPALRAFHDAGKPIFGTCAGAILVVYLLLTAVVAGAALVFVPG